MPCAPDEVFNPKTGRCVKRLGKIGKAMSSYRTPPDAFLVTIPGIPGEVNARKVARLLKRRPSTTHVTVRDAVPHGEPRYARAKLSKNKEAWVHALTGRVPKPKHLGGGYWTLREERRHYA